MGISLVIKLIPILVPDPNYATPRSARANNPSDFL